jgi:hypothetical protein
VTRLSEWELEADDNFTASLLAETGRTTMLFPDRHKRFIPVGPLFPIDRRLPVQQTRTRSIPG